MPCVVTDPCVVSEQVPGAGVGSFFHPGLGYSTQMHSSSIAKFRFPDGTYWAKANPCLVESAQYETGVDA